MRSRLLIAAAVLACAAPGWAQSVSLTLRDGRVTLVTQNAMPSAILAEWARLGQVRIVDGERVPGTPLTLRLENVPEREALDIVLRAAAGYIAAPRTQSAGPSQSKFDRVVVMATSPGAATAARMASVAPARSNAAMAPAPQMVSAPVEEDMSATQQMVADGGDGSAMATPGGDTVGGEQPVSSTNFDYANPQRYFAARQAAQQAAEGAQQQQQGQTPQQPSVSPFGGQTSSRPGFAPAPPAPAAAGGAAGAPPVNPYGLPAGDAPGSAPTPSTLEPDRAKYINPYAPTPPRPPN